ncbi:hypothetical protein DFQ28_001038 [Apophysomyces sp. BC1034]|nr:hypothetical protein DFQ28_001038 [Apophysomyces sp. BC1034]
MIKILRRYKDVNKTPRDVRISAGYINKKKKASKLVAEALSKRKEYEQHEQRQLRMEVYKDFKSLKLDYHRKMASFNETQFRLSDVRTTRYELEKALKEYKKRKGKARGEEMEDTSEEEGEEDDKVCGPESWIRPGCEASVDRLDIRKLLQEADQVRKTIVFSGTDYGLNVLSTTVPITIDRAMFYLELYNRHQMPNMNNPDDGNGIDLSNIPDEMLKLPKPIRLNKEVFDAQKKIQVASLERAYTLEDVVENHKIASDCRKLLQKFYYSNRAHKDKITKEIYKRRAYDRVAANERQTIASSALPRGTSSKNVIPVMAIGTQGTCVGSRIKGHLRYGGKWLRERHHRYTPVCMTDGFRSSQACIFCFRKVIRPQGRNFHQTAKVNGSSECVNPDCISYKTGRTTQNRNVEAALANRFGGNQQHILSG